MDEDQPTMSSQQRQQAPAQRKRPLTPEEVAHRWRLGAKIALFTAAGLIVLYLSWTYLVPLLQPRLFPARLPDEIPIEDIVAEFKDDADAAARKYDNKRIVVEGKLVVEPAKPGKAGGRRIYFQVSDGNGDDLEVPVEFFDIDDAGSVDPGDQVALSGLIKREGAGKFRFVNAGLMPGQ